MSFAFLLQYETATRARARAKNNFIREMTKETEQNFETLLDDAIV